MQRAGQAGPQGLAALPERRGELNPVCLGVPRIFSCASACLSAHLTWTLAVPHCRLLDVILFTRSLSRVMGYKRQFAL